MNPGPALTFAAAVATILSLTATSSRADEVWKLTDRPEAPLATETMDFIGGPGNPGKAQLGFIKNNGQLDFEIHLSDMPEGPNTIVSLEGTNGPVFQTPVQCSNIPVCIIRVPANSPAYESTVKQLFTKEKDALLSYTVGGTAQGLMAIDLTGFTRIYDQASR